MTRLLVPTERVRLCPEFVGIWEQSHEFFQSWNAGTNTTVPARKYNCIVPARLQSMHHLKSIPDGNVAVVFQDAGDASRIDQLLGPLSVQLEKPFVLRYCVSNKSFCSNQCFASSRDTSCLKHITPGSALLLYPRTTALSWDVEQQKDTDRRKRKPVEQPQLLRPVSSEMEQPQSLKEAQACSADVLRVDPRRALFGDEAALNQSARRAVLNRSLKKPQLCSEAESAALDLTRWPTSSQWAPTVVLEQQALHFDTSSMTAWESCGVVLHGKVVPCNQVAQALRRNGLPYNLTVPGNGDGHTVIRVSAGQNPMQALRQPSSRLKPRQPSGAAPEVVSGPSEPPMPKAGAAEMGAIEVEVECEADMEVDLDPSLVTVESFVVEQPALRLAPCVPADVLDIEAAATARAAPAATAAAAATTAAATYFFQVYSKSSTNVFVRT